MGREEEILKILKRSKKAIPGGEIAKKLGMSRQMIVQYIAKLRADGHKIISTPKGYRLEKESEGVRKLVAVQHTEEEIYDELIAIVKAGGRVIDVIVDHPIYGEIKGLLDIETEDDVVRFVQQLKLTKAHPLLRLTDGVHLHTLEADSEDIMKRVMDAIKNFLIVGGDEW